MSEGAGREADRAWVQGIVLGSLHKLGEFDLDQGRDLDGVYLPFFDVRPAGGGGAVRVSFEVLLDAAESDAYANGGEPR